MGLFSPSPSPSPTQQLGITPRRATPSPQSIGTAGVGLSSPAFSSSSAIVFNTSSSPDRQKTTQKKKNSGDHPWFHNQLSSFTRGTHSQHTRHPRTRSIASTYSRSRTEDCRRDRNPNGHHHLQGEQASSHSHSRLHASNVIVKKKYTRDTHRSRSFAERMPSRLDRNAHFLRLLSSSKPRLKKKLIEHATKDQVDTLSELALNVLKGTIPLESRQ